MASGDRPTQRRDEHPKLTVQTHGIFAIGGAVVTIGGIVVAGYGFDNEENVRSGPMVVGGFSAAGGGAADGIGFGISWFLEDARLDDLHLDKNGYCRCT